MATWGPLARYAAAVVATAVALALRFALTPVLAVNVPYITFFPAVVVAAFLGGLGPGLLATALSAGFAAWWVRSGAQDAPPVPSAVAGVAGLVVFAVMGTAMSVAAGLQRSFRARLAEQEKLITERRRAEKALRRHDVVVQQSRDIILFMRREDGRILEANPAATAAYGYTRDELLGLSIHDLRAPETRAVIESQMSQAGAGGVLFESVHRRKDGSTFPVEVSSRGVEVDGALTLISIVRDITERKRAEEALREADRRKDEFLGMLSHELRNPLAPIRNSTYILQHAEPGSAQARRAQLVIERQTGHLTRLVDDLLDVTRIARGKIELQRARVDAREVVRKACDDHQTLFRDRHLELRIEISEPVWIEADEMRIAQVVGNLLQNAAKFSHHGGSVIASVGAAGGHAEIRVRDDGIGITPELLPQVFEPFVQAEGGLARTKGGLGLGLALVKGLSELHGGTAAARSDGPGKGSEFIVSLPLAPPPAPRADAPSPAARPRGMDILVIEDNVDAAQSVAEVLELEGHRVHVATDGQSGIQKARELRPEVVLCDIGLPDVDGYEIARTLRGDERLRSTRLIALSGYAQPEDRRRAREAGFDAHIAKPPSPDALLSSVAGGEGR